MLQAAALSLAQKGTASPQKTPVSERVCRLLLVVCLECVDCSLCDLNFLPPTRCAPRIPCFCFCFLVVQFGLWLPAAGRWFHRPRAARARCQAGGLHCPRLPRARDHNTMWKEMGKAPREGEGRRGQELGQEGARMRASAPTPAAAGRAATPTPGQRSSRAAPLTGTPPHGQNGGPFPESPNKMFAFLGSAGALTGLPEGA